MARQNSHSPISVHIETTFMDDSGEVVHVAHYREEMIQDPATGDIVSRKVGENMTLASGESFNPSMSAGANPVMLVGTCSFCNSARKRFSLWRNRKSNPLCNVKHLKRCLKCGKPACPKHIRCSQFDNQWRCLKHHRLHMLFMGIFFEEAEK